MWLQTRWFVQDYSIKAQPLCSRQPQTDWSRSGSCATPKLSQRSQTWMQCTCFVPRFRLSTLSVNFRPLVTNKTMHSWLNISSPFSPNSSNHQRKRDTKWSCFMKMVMFWWIPSHLKQLRGWKVGFSSRKGILTFFFVKSSMMLHLSWQSLDNTHFMCPKI